MSDLEKQIINDWDELKCNKKLLRGINSSGFEKPSPIQKKAILPLLSGRDIIAQAQSGTGKTGCFTIGTLQSLDLSIKKTQVIILSPTRELSKQIFDVISGLGQYMKDLKIQLLIGGTQIDDSKRELETDVPHVVVGCPGRVHDMFRRKCLKSSHLKLLVLDEADEMLSSGFKEQIYQIFQYLPPDIQVGLFSATMPYEIEQLSEKFMRDPIKILVKSEQLTLEGIKQFYISINDDEEKILTLKDLFGATTVSQCIIYCNSIKRVQDLYEAMISENFPVCRIHSGMEREERENSYRLFKEGKYRVLLSSNVTARGIDIQQVGIVINFDLSKNIQTYLHRIGRSGRWGRKGVAINFVTRKDIRLLKDIENHYVTTIEELPSNWASNL